MAEKILSNLQYLTKSNRILKIERSRGTRVDAALITLDGKRVGYVRSLIVEEDPAVLIALPTGSSPDIIAVLEEVGFKTSIKYF